MGDTDMRKPSILFVDDEEPILTALQRQLRDEPFDVRVETDPIRALAEIRRDPPSVVVADYHMPKMKGPDLLCAVRKHSPGTVRMILTGRPDLGALMRAVNEAHVHQFVLKPWDDDELRLLLRAAVAYGRVVRERDDLMSEVERQREALRELEREQPGLTKLPRRDEDGAYILTKEDLP